MSTNKKTKIVATLGPACSTREVLKDMIEAGVNVFRVNFSHADYNDVKAKIDLIRGLNEEFGYTTAILGDLQGPKLRVGVMTEDVVVNDGDLITFQTAEDIPGTAQRVYMNYKEFPKDVNPGERILLDDGKLIFEAVETDRKSEVVCKVIQGGPLKSKKGVNLPNTKVSLPALTAKDVKDAIFAIEQKVDWIALSFVRTAEDLIELQELIAQHSDHKIPIVAKIEKPEGVANIDKIVAYCDGLMVARGDLGVEVPAHEVPLIQKKLVNRAKTARIPVIIATQMMETMITSLTPTRAEVNDVANSVMDGADAVMLSGETSVGNYPVQVIEKMTQIIEAVEDSPLIQVPQNTPQVRTNRFVTKAICHHAATLANVIKAKAICTLTNSGYTAFQISAWRPSAHILVYTSNKSIVTQLNLLWGVKSFYYDKSVSTDETVTDVNNIAKENGFVSKGDFLINLAAMPIVDKGMVNTMRVSEIE
ncbi:pyruvate kinase [Flavobacterium branchiophilum]|uniref:Pyruvate kinase n=2 Tax=Flavobacterium branchiophilum TaxID=55197 RepID=G2Z437_FLABF|nr:pyruvate kinase [Flavobacterium branchiophilum]OXA82177.1 pyruvate kinase [Flavobacterium branchiophilum] [Flavobacterium branchiophilum NBRC 15030 = ATCC 35035]PDS23091.1 pyruvate kinase [Flavobacterium branchiophilum]TQM40734.1 pyruvate kinase [Flavobacterium branchiophilum]CCB68380.1 Pyruvate kinase [Flavobacterium branchiophilum FL-15]GEM55551.1 pyruvate kinase [Flavobacterium branchiophilum NBRC 15030 = ATCC 35035]